MNNVITSSTQLSCRDALTPGFATDWEIRQGYVGVGDCTARASPVGGEL